MNKIMPFAATWMDLEIIIVCKVSQTEETKIIYMQNSKMIQVNLFTQQKQTHRNRKQIHGLGKWGRDKLGVWVTDTHYYV